MEVAALAAAAGGLAGGLVVFALAKARQRLEKDGLLRRLEAAFTRISGEQAASLFESGIPTEVALERIEEAIEAMASSNATAVESQAILCRALDEVGLAAAIYTISGDLVYENFPARELLDRRFGQVSLRSTIEALVSKSLWSGVELCEEVHPGGTNSPIVSVKSAFLEGEKKRLGVMCIISVKEHKEPVELDALCHRVAQKLQESARHRFVSLLVYNPPPNAKPKSVYTQPETVEALLESITIDSVRRSDPGAAVEIGAARINDEVWLWVADEVASTETDEETDNCYRAYVPRAEQLLKPETFDSLAEAAGAHLDIACIEGKGRRFTLKFSLPKNG